MSIRHVALALAALVVGACDLPNDPNLNNPSVTDFSTIADLPHLQALVTGVLGGGADMLCSAAAPSPFSGMLPMYLLMSAFHAAPWLKLIAGRRPK